MLDVNGFDRWADEYDGAVAACDGGDRYPFAGYGEVLDRIYRVIAERPKAAVLDLGFGTGALAARLYRDGCAVYGQDFSAGMIGLARKKMPGAYLCRGDLSDGLAAPLAERDYDFIVSTYALHHLTDGRRLSLLDALRRRLKPDGAILIGDVAFETREQLERCRREAGDEWDDEENYFVADELRERFPDLTFARVSFCAGILTLTRPMPSA